MPTTAPPSAGAPSVAALADALAAVERSAAQALILDDALRQAREAIAFVEGLIAGRVVERVDGLLSPALERAGVDPAEANERRAAMAKVAQKGAAHIDLGLLALECLHATTKSFWILADETLAHDLRTEIERRTEGRDDV